MTAHPETHITIELAADHDFKIEDLWPDGDAPDEVTAEVVADLIKQCGGLRRVTHDWNLDDPRILDAHITVRSRNPHWGQDTVLFEELAPAQWIRSRARVSAL